jgi:hypothetical protein
MQSAEAIFGTTIKQLLQSEQLGEGSGAIAIIIIIIITAKT